MEACTATDPQADACKFTARNINARSIGAGDCCDLILGHEVNNTLFKCRDQFPHADVCAFDIKQRINHQLPRSVKRDLATTVDLHDWNVAWRQQMLFAGVEAHRKNRWVFYKPDLVGCIFIARVGELLHLVPERHVLLQAPKDGLHSAISTSWCAETSR